MTIEITKSNVIQWLNDYTDLLCIKINNLIIDRF